MQGTAQLPRSPNRFPLPHFLYLIYLVCFLLLAHSLACAKTQSLCLQSLPHSFPQNTRGGGTSAPPWRTKMKLQAADPSALSTRCQFYTPSGRQCRLFASDQNSLLCSHHLAIEKQKDTSNVYAPLIRNSQGLQTAQGINYSLSNLYELLAKIHISPRRAAVLAYINSLLLRTLPQIDADNTAGIKDPTKLPPKPLTELSPVPVPDKVVASNQPSAPDTVNAWDFSNPEPDLKKKPS